MDDMLGSILLIMNFLSLTLLIIVLLKQNKKTNKKADFLIIQKMMSDQFGDLREIISKSINGYANQTNKEMYMFQNSLNKDLTSFKDNLQRDINAHFDRVNNNLNVNLDKINNKVELRLNEGFEKTNKTFNNIIERLSKIDEAQRKIESLSTNIVSLQDVLTDKKSRGTFGEVQLSHILKSIFGDNNKKIYELQKKVSNECIVDAILYTPAPLGNISIDSKFPFENYRRMIDVSLSEFARKEAEKKFKQDVKKHINDIKTKYIIPGETANQAIMFIPAEAIFAEINAYHDDIIQYSQKQKVWLASPTTLMSLLTTVQVILTNIERDKYAAIIHDELNRLGQEFSRYQERWNKLTKNIDQVSKSVYDIHVTSDKIGRRFENISKVEFSEKEPKKIFAVANLEEE